MWLWIQFVMCSANKICWKEKVWLRASSAVIDVVHLAQRVQSAVISVCQTVWLKIISLQRILSGSCVCPVLLHSEDWHWFPLFFTLCSWDESELYKSITLKHEEKYQNWLLCFYEEYLFCLSFHPACEVIKIWRHTIELDMASVNFDSASPVFRL